MTSKEAIEIVTNAIQTEKMTAEQDKALSIVQKAVEKQISKKCNIWNNQASCPNCDRLFGNLIDVGHWGNPHFCDDCGQALDWGDNK